MIKIEGSEKSDSGEDYKLLSGQKSEIYNGSGQ